MATDWARGLCNTGYGKTGYDPEIFFLPEYTYVAKGICSVCPIRWDCLDRALAEGIPFGVWGGMDEDDRRKLSYPYHRVRCPGCRSTAVDSDGRVEICHLCGLSWRV